MQFYEKLIFLLNLTQTTNRMLAQELQVDPSLISRFRTGRRLPRNREHIKSMSSYFARRCTTEYQRQALSQMLGIRQAFTMKKKSRYQKFFIIGSAGTLMRSAVLCKPSNPWRLKADPNIHPYIPNL